MEPKFKNVIFKKLYLDLKNAEIIPYKDSYWFIDRENKYWYFEYEKSGTLWWRYDFFNNFFHLFSLDMDNYQPIMSEWVEEVLNFKVNTTSGQYIPSAGRLEEVLNCKVNTTTPSSMAKAPLLEEVLNCKVNTINKNK